MVLEFASAMGINLVTAFEAINRATTTFSEEQGNNLLSIEEFREEVSEARRNLSDYGDTSTLTARQLTELAKAHGNTGSQIVLLQDLYAGAIDLATGFSDTIHSQEVAADLLADKFIEVATAQGVAKDQAEALAGQIRDQTISLEEAIVQLNQLAGLSLDLSQFTLDPTVLLKDIEQLVQQVTDIGEAFGQALSEGAAEGLDPKEAREQFLEFIREAFFDAAVAKFVQANLAALFEGVDLSEPLSFSSEQVEQLGDKFEVLYGQLLDILEAAGLLPPELEEAAAAAEELVDRTSQLRDVLIQGLVGAVDIPTVLGDTLTAFHDSLAETIVSGVVDGFLQSAAVKGVLDPLFQEIEDLFTEFSTTGDSIALFSGLSAAFKKADPEMQKLLNEFGELAKLTEDHLKKWGLITEEIEETTEATEKFGKAVEEAAKQQQLFLGHIGTQSGPVPQEFIDAASQMASELESAVSSSLTEGLIDAFRDQGVQGVIDQLSANAQGSLQEAITNAVLNGFVNTVILAALAPLFASIGTAVTAFFDPMSQAFGDSATLSSIIVAELGKIPGIMTTIAPEIAKGLDELEKAGILTTTPAPAPVSVAPSGGGSVGSTATQLADVTQAFTDAVAAINDLIEQFSDDAEDLASNLLEVASSASVAIGELLTAPVGNVGSIQSVLDGINQTLGRFDISVGLEDLTNLDAILTDLPRHVQRQIQQTVTILDISLRQMGSSVEGIVGLINSLSAAAAEEQRQIIDDFLAAQTDSLQIVDQNTDSLADLTNAYNEAVAAILANVDLLDDYIDVNAELALVYEQIIAQVRLLRTELLEPVAEAIADLTDIDPAPLAAFLQEIASTSSFADLEDVRDRAVAAIQDALEASISAAEEASEERIAALEAERDVAIEGLEERAEKLQDLIDLNEQLEQEQIRALQEQLRLVDQQIAETGRLRDTWERLQGTLTDTVDKLLLGPESPLTPTERLGEAQRQFEEQLAILRNRSASSEERQAAAQQLPQLAQALLKEGSNVLSSTDQFQDLFRFVTTALQDAAHIASNQVGKAETQIEVLQSQRETLQDQLDALQGASDTLTQIQALSTELGLTGTETVDQLQNMIAAITGAGGLIEQQQTVADLLIEQEQVHLEAQTTALKEQAIADLNTLTTFLGDKFDELSGAITQAQMPAAVPVQQSSVDALTEEVRGLRSDINALLAAPVSAQVNLTGTLQVGGSQLGRFVVEETQYNLNRGVITVPSGVIRPR